jgi:Rieske 2Fe-2S family protein
MPPSPVSAEEVAATRRPVDQARLLPPHVFHDPQVFDYELRAWFERNWLCVAREEDVAQPGSYVLASLPTESAIVIRDRAGELHALSNVCRHRGSTILDEAQGHAVRLQCPYHAWIYDLDGSLMRAPHTQQISDFETADHGLRRLRLETWQGFVFVNFDTAAGPHVGPLADQLADLPPHVEAHNPANLRRAKRIEYDVRANWKVIAENYSECYHCPGVHPQLNRLTPYDRGHNFESQGPWAGGWMELIDDAETMSTSGHTGGRPPLPGLGADDQRRIYYFVVWPNLLLSLHPDYVMTHQVWPVEPGRSRVICEWHFDPQPPGLGRL